MGNSQRSKILRVLGYLKPYIGLQLLLVMLAVLVAGLQFAYPWSLKWLIDEVMTQKQGRILVPTILVLFLVGILIALVQMLQVQPGERIAIVSTFPTRFLSNEQRLDAMAQRHQETQGKEFHPFFAYPCTLATLRQIFFGSGFARLGIAALARAPWSTCWHASMSRAGVKSSLMDRTSGR